MEEGGRFLGQYIIKSKCDDYSEIKTLISEDGKKGMT